MGSKDWEEFMIAVEELMNEAIEQIESDHKRETPLTARMKEFLSTI